MSQLHAAFITECANIPDKELKVYGMYNRQAKATDVDYDRIVFDTYDYLDKIIGFKLKDVYVAAFEQYYEKVNDENANKMAKLIKYGTINEKEIWMLRYGFSFEDIEWLEPYVISINQEEVVFRQEVKTLSSDKREVIKRFE